MNKKVVVNALTLALIVGVAGLCSNLGFAEAEESGTVSGDSVSGDNVSGNDPEVTYDLGDVNLDGQINYLDAMLVLQSDAELKTLSETQLAMGDVNGDNEVNYLDATLILKYDAQLITSFDAE